MKFTEAKLEEAIIELLGEQGYPHSKGGEHPLLIDGVRTQSEVLIKADLQAFLAKRYQSAGITDGEIESIIRKLETLPASDLYDSNKTFCKWLSDGFLLKRESASTAGSASQKDLYIQLLDYDNVEASVKQSLFPDAVNANFVDSTADQKTLKVAEDNVAYLADAKASKATDDGNIYRVVSQLEIVGATGEKRIPDAILYINGLPLVVFEFKSAIREKAPIFEAFEQLTIRYRRAIPQLFVFNTLCVISDGVNNKMGNLFAPYQFFYSWGKVTGQELVAEDGINSLHTMLQGLFDKARLRDVMRHFVFFPDTSKKEIKIVPRYPQYYAAKKLFENIKTHQKPMGDGKGGLTLVQRGVVRVIPCSFYRDC